MFPLIIIKQVRPALAPTVTSSHMFHRIREQTVYVFLLKINEDGALITAIRTSFSPSLTDFLAESSSSCISDS